MTTTTTNDVTTNGTKPKKATVVNFDEQHNTTVEVPRVALQDKANVWHSKADIQVFRLQTQEEVLLQKVKGLVMDKVRVEAVAEGAELSEDAIEAKAHEIMERGTDQVLAFVSGVMEQSNQNTSAQELTMIRQVKGMVQQKLDAMQVFTPDEVQQKVAMIMMMNKNKIREFLEAPIEMSTLSTTTTSSSSSSSSGGDGGGDGADEEESEALLPKKRTSGAFDEQQAISTMNGNQQQRRPQVGDEHYNWIIDCTDTWLDLPLKIQEAAQILGYTEQLWDEFIQPDESNQWWQDLTPQQQASATVLGFDASSWDGQVSFQDVYNDTTTNTNTNNDKEEEEAEADLVEEEEESDDPLFSYKSKASSSMDEGHNDDDIAAEEEFLANFLLDGDDDDDGGGDEKTADDPPTITPRSHDDDVKAVAKAWGVDNDTEAEDEFISNFLQSSENGGTEGILSPTAPVVVKSKRIVGEDDHVTKDKEEEFLPANLFPVVDSSIIDPTENDKTDDPSSTEDNKPPPPPELVSVLKQVALVVIPVTLAILYQTYKSSSSRMR
jgi:hypothetical protein